MAGVMPDVHFQPKNTATTYLLVGPYLFPTLLSVGDWAGLSDWLGLHVCCNFPFAILANWWLFFLSCVRSIKISKLVCMYGAGLKSPAMRIQWNQSVLPSSDADYSSMCSSRDEHEPQNVLPGKQLLSAVWCTIINETKSLKLSQKPNYRDIWCWDLDLKTETERDLTEILALRRAKTEIMASRSKKPRPNVWQWDP